MAINLEELGFSQEELQNRVVDRIANDLLSSYSYNPNDDREYKIESQFKQSIEKKIVDQINSTISALAEKYVLPNVAQYIEDLTLTQTNQWGEKKGNPVTFIEYLVQRAQDYMQEKVNFEGKSKIECGSYSFSPTQTRITHLIEKHLHFSIETAMKDALKVATGEIARGIHETARVKLNEIASSIKVDVKTK